MIDHRSLKNPAAAEAPRPELSALARVPAAAAFIVFAPTLVLAMMVRFIMLGLDASLYRDSPLASFIVSSICSWTVISLGYLWLRRKGVGRADLGVRRARASDIALGMFAAAVNILVVYPLSVLIVRSLGLGEIRDAITYPVTLWNVLGTVFFLVLVIPLAEEILFRGFFLNLLRSKTGNLWLVGLLGCLAFAVVHLPRWGLSGALFILLWAVVPVCLFLARRSIVPSFTMHVLNNVFAYVVLPSLLS
jgi:membrane protease YdiL (CAAX protease family)